MGGILGWGVGTVLIAEDGQRLFMQNLTKEQMQPAEIILRQVIFYNIFILCLWLRIITRSDQNA